MKQEMVITIKTVDKQSKKVPNLDPQDKVVRIYKRAHTKNQYYRKIIIPLREIIHLKSQNATILNREADEQQSALIQEYLLQNSIVSQYVVKNIRKTIQNNKMIWLQDDYLCLLSEFQFHDLSFQKRINLFSCIATAVKDMSNALVCHRSLSPSTICIVKADSDKYIAKINNFQRAVALKNKRSTIQIPMQTTSPYSSPELRLGKNYGLASDIWSLGCLLNFILYETMENIWEQNEQVLLEVPEGTPDWLLQLLKSMLHEDPTKRYPISTILDIAQACQKCIQILGKYVPLGKDSLKLKRVASKLSCQRQH